MIQAELAERYRRRANYAQKIEYGTAVPSLPMLAKLAAALGVPVATLFRAAKPRKATLGRPRERKSVPAKRRA